MNKTKNNQCNIMTGIQTLWITEITVGCGGKKILTLYFRCIIHIITDCVHLALSYFWEASLVQCLVEAVGQGSQAGDPNTVKAPEINKIS